MRKSFGCDESQDVALSGSNTSNETGAIPYNGVRMFRLRLQEAAGEGRVICPGAEGSPFFFFNPLWRLQIKHMISGQFEDCHS